MHGRDRARTRGARGPARDRGRDRPSPRSDGAGRRAAEREPRSRRRELDAHSKPRTAANLFCAGPRERPSQVPPAHGRDRRRRSSARCCSPSPARPIYKKPTLGLDLQGGLEVVLKARCRRRREAADDPGRDATASARSCQTAIDKLGVSSPEVRKQGSEPDRDPARRRPRPGEGGEDHRHDRRSCRSSTSSRTSSRPVDRGRDRRAARRDAVALRAAHGRAEGRRARARPRGVLPLPDRQEDDKTKVKGKTARRRRRPTKLDAGRPPSALRTCKQLLRPYGGKRPAGTQILKVPAHREPVVVPERQRAAVPAPARTAPRTDGKY